MTLADFVYHLDDETWVGIGLPAADGGGMVVFWVADYVGGYGMTMENVGPYLDRDIYDDVYLEMFDDPKRVACMHPKMRKPDQNEMNWYGKGKGGCQFWAPGKEFLVRVTWPVHKVYSVEAGSGDEALAKARAMVDSGEVCVWTDGFEADEANPTIELE